MSRYYNSHFDDFDGLYLEHYGVKGMKWKNHVYKIKDYISSKKKRAKKYYNKLTNDLDKLHSENVKTAKNNAAKEALKTGRPDLANKKYRQKLKELNKINEGLKKERTRETVEYVINDVGNDVKKSIRNYQKNAKKSIKKSKKTINNLKIKSNVTYDRNTLKKDVQNIENLRFSQNNRKKYLKSLEDFEYKLADLSDKYNRMKGSTYNKDVIKLEKAINEAHDLLKKKYREAGVNYIPIVNNPNSFKIG